MPKMMRSLVLVAAGLLGACSDSHVSQPVFSSESYREYGRRFERMRLEVEGGVSTVHSIQVSEGLKFPKGIPFPFRLESRKRLVVEVPWVDGHRKANVEVVYGAGVVKYKVAYRIR